MQKLVFMILVIILLLGCASAEKYDRKLSSLIGQKSDVLSQEFGAPSGKKILGNGYEVVSFTSVNNNYVPSDFFLYQPYDPAGDVSIYAPFDQDYDFTPFAQNFNQLPELICQTSFLIRNGTIIAWKTKGNNCISQ